MTEPQSRLASPATDSDSSDPPSSEQRSDQTDLENALRVTSDNFLTRVERLHALEEQKRELPISEMVGIADEVEALTREILEWAVRQADLARAAEQEDPPDARPIAIIPPRALPIVLEAWRASERVLQTEAPGTAAWESARADVERLRDEYARSYRAYMANAPTD